MKLDIKPLCYWLTYNYKPSLQIKYKDNYKTNKIQINTVIQYDRWCLGFRIEKNIALDLILFCFLYFNFSDAKSCKYPLS